MQYTFDWKHSKNTPRDLEWRQVGDAEAESSGSDSTHDGGSMQNSTRKPSVTSAGGSCVSAERLRVVISNEQKRVRRPLVRL